MAKSRRGHGLQVRAWLAVITALLTFVTAALYAMAAVFQLAAVAAASWARR